MHFGIYVEIQSQGDKDKDFRNFLDAIGQLRHSIIEDGVKFDEIDFAKALLPEYQRKIPFFGSNGANKWSPTLPNINCPYGVIRYSHIVGTINKCENPLDLLGPYIIPEISMTSSKERFGALIVKPGDIQQRLGMVHATAYIATCGNSFPNYTSDHLVRIYESPD